VHPRFWHFFVLLWFCSKLEYVVRACTKQWLETIPVKPCQANFTSLCEEYTSQNVEFNENLYNLFVKGLDYVTLSLTVYKDKYALQPILAPPDDYLVENEDEAEEEDCSDL
jgi:hypothetical protein